MQMETRNIFLLSSMLLLFHWFTSQYCSTAMDIINPLQPLLYGQTLTSSGQKFELGFFRPNNSTQYIGIWYTNLSPRKVIWVANREKPILSTDTSASLRIGSDQNLKLLDGNQDIVWATNGTNPSNSSVFATLLDNGNLVLKDGSGSGVALWESFHYPGDTFLANMTLGMNNKTGEKRFLTSWKSEDDPSPGNFVFGMVPQTPPQCFVWINGSTPYVRSGQWDRSKYIGIPEMDASYLNGHEIQQDIERGTAYLTVSYPNSSQIRYTVMTSVGLVKVISWDEGKAEWSTFWETPKHPCDIYGACGPFGVCNQFGSPICTCLKGFVPRSSEDWNKGNWTRGCVRRVNLLCQKNMGSSLSLASARGKEDGFWRMGGMKLPDLSELISLSDAPNCYSRCLSDCSCVAYAYVDGIGCMIWITDLMDIQQFSFAGEDLFLRLAHSELAEEKKPAILIISLTVVSSVIILGTAVYGWIRLKAKQRGKRIGLVNDLYFRRDPVQESGWRNHGKQRDRMDLPLFDFKSIDVATNNFSFTNKLGQGGFGPVYKGKLLDGKEIAVKRLFNSSGQGEEEFKNEIILISKLQHRNLVRLLGYCIKGEEKLLIYEYMHNRSLDNFLFDPTKRAKLNWAKRFNIIQGISRGLLYLHRDSCLRVIHRDLKVSNILLDEHMNPKISDFGMARTFQETQDIANTHRVVGTFGYMAPEYTMRGIFSEKSDVFSFGVLLLEIVSGKKNTSFHYLEQHLSLLGYAWQLWTQHRVLDLLDDTLEVDSLLCLEVMRCIHVGLLCVQDNAKDRPFMSAVVSMLNTETDRPKPKQPPFSCLSSSDHSSQCNSTPSLNEVTKSEIEGR